MLIEYYKKKLYGRVCTYIVDKNVAEGVSDLTKRKTISEADLVALTKMGFQLKEIQIS